ncbi:Long-chain-fatty-acid--CoA ligase [Xylophilus ampelinus]|nr:Long-chain-fatty-acid--CoA ligase [Xylophilus ampelinus]
MNGLESGPTVSSMLRESAARFSRKEAVVCGDLRLCYADLLRAATALAGTLLRRGAAGERVAVLMDNGAAIVVALYGIWEAGAQAVPLNPECTERELNEILVDADVHSAVCGAAQHARLGALLERGGRWPLLVIDDADVQRLIEEGSRPSLPPPAPDSLAIVQYTGGTTGPSKGVVLTDRNVAVNVRQRDAAIPMEEGRERILCVAPLYHSYATAMALFPALSSGGTLVILARFKPESVFDAIERERITLFAGAPPVFDALWAHPELERRDLSSLSASFSGLAPLAVDVLERWQRLSGAAILEGYGLTEASPVLTFNPRHGTRKPGSVGPAMRATEIEIVDPADGKRILARGSVGEVRARGPQLMVGYHQCPVETQDRARDGWLYTGDLGELDEDGYLFIRWRKEELVIVGGFDVNPREVEEVLRTLTGVEDCGVIGVRDNHRGDILQAFVVRHSVAPLTIDDVPAHCTRSLVRHKVPSYLGFVDAMPRTTVGKLDRNVPAALAATRSRETA